MPFAINRRQLLSTGAVLALGLTPFPARSSETAPGSSRYGDAQAFDFDLLRAKAKQLAAAPFEAEKPPVPELVTTIDFDAVQKIKFRADRAVCADGASSFPIRFFHLDKFNGLPVRINVVSDGMAREVVYSREDFDYGDARLAASLPADLGFCGFRVMNGRDVDTDWLAFQGASYFRSAGEEDQYGASARGIAIDTAIDEEVPRFIEFWLEEKGNEPTVTIYALLNGPSLAGAYKFEATKDRGAVIGITLELFPRKDIERLGIAPLTSMYWYAEGDRRYDADWRPEIHDSDGLALQTGSGERIWRPLINPPSVHTNSFLDANPQGLRAHAARSPIRRLRGRRRVLQPAAEHLGGARRRMGRRRGPARRDTDGRRSARQYCRLLGAQEAGQSRRQPGFSYRLFFRDDEPQVPADLARAVATRAGVDGIPGKLPTTTRISVSS